MTSNHNYIIEGNQTVHKNGDGSVYGEPIIISEPIDMDEDWIPKTPVPDDNGQSTQNGGQSTGNEPEYLKIPMPTDEQIRSFYNQNKTLIWSTGAFIGLVVLLK